MKKIKKILKDIIKFIKWNIEQFILKYDHIYIKLKYNFSDFLKIIVFTFSYIFILFKLNIIVFEDKIIFNKLNFETYFTDLVIAQISITFLTTAIISLISSLEDKYVLGEKLTNKVFGYKCIYFYLSFVFLNIGMIFNIVFMINKSNANFLLCIFILSIYILIDIVNRIGHLFISTRKERELLLCEYYLENKKIILNKIVPRNYDSRILVNLKEQTLKLILNKDLQYIYNISGYQVIINKMFYNMPLEVQEYYLSVGCGKSVLDDFIEIMENLILVGETNRAIQLYKWLLNKLDYYNIYINTEKLNHISDELFSKITDLQNEYLVKEYLSNISSIIYGIERQLYFGLTNDLSYITEDRQLLYYSFSDSKYFKKIYDNIYTNKYLSLKEKNNCYTKIFEIFRMSCYYSKSIMNDISNNTYKYKEVKKRQLPYCILGQATALLFLSMLKNKDGRGIKLFMQMNIGEESMYYAIHTTILTLLKIEVEEQNKNLYCDYYGLDLKWCKKFIEENFNNIFCTTKNVEYGNYHNIIVKLKDSYSYISKLCTEKDDDFDRNFNYIDYMCKYKSILIDKYFEHISNYFNFNSIKTQEDKRIELALSSILPIKPKENK